MGPMKTHYIIRLLQKPNTIFVRLGEMSYTIDVNELTLLWIILNLYFKCVELLTLPGIYFTVDLTHYNL
jgi:hypothetical protein